MKKLLNQLCVVFAAATLFIGTMMSNGACHFDYYQPKVPDKMRK